MYQYKKIQIIEKIIPIVHLINQLFNIIVFRTKKLKKETLKELGEILLISIVSGFILLYILLGCAIELIFSQKGGEIG